MKDGIQDALDHENQFTKEVIQKYAKKHTLDPFEFSLDLSLFCDLIIGDYNYLFDPRVYLQRYFSNVDRAGLFSKFPSHRDRTLIPVGKKTWQDPPGTKQEVELPKNKTPKNHKIRQEFKRPLKKT